ncbi:hypothetical protein [Tannerella forsythia]|uniref:hypothetical protein n=1 Tax=Tannerella forsythia TaxID=28112 RepID=UPI000764C1AE|nr:hypothetical protein [Tannerella forsythia]
MATNEKKKKDTEDAETTQDAAQINPATVEQQDTEATADASTGMAQEQPTQEATQKETLEELQEVARSLMREHSVSQVYRCPVNGYWFIREEYVNEYVKETGIEVETYTNEVKVEDHDA